MSSNGSESDREDSYSDTDSNPDTDKGLYETMCVNHKEWMVDRFANHRLIVNSGEDLVEEISSFSKGLGERSLSVLTLYGHFSGITLSCPDVKIESPIEIIHLCGAFESGKIVRDLSVRIGNTGISSGIVDGGCPLVASETVQVSLVSYRKRPRNLKRVRSDVEDPDTVNFYYPLEAEDFYNLSCVNRKEWIADHFLTHRLPVNNGEDLIEKISSFSKGLGDRSLSVFSIWGLFSGVTLSRPDLTIKSAKILRLRGVFESGKIVGDLSARLHYDGVDIDGGIIAAGPLIASESMELTLVSYLKRPRNLKRPRKE